MTCSRGCCPSQRDHYLSLAISATATPTSRPVAAQAVEREKRWDKDHSAYRRMVKNGVQPRGLDGAARAEQQAEIPFELESGRLMRDNKERKRYESALGDMP